jgi:hypothetical protein
MKAAELDPARLPPKGEVNKRVCADPGVTEGEDVSDANWAVAYLLRSSIPVFYDWKIKIQDLRADIYLLWRVRHR